MAILGSLATGSHNLRDADLRDAGLRAGGGPPLGRRRRGRPAFLGAAAGELCAAVLALLVLCGRKAGAHAAPVDQLPAPVAASH
ncbi:hypothetical protein [Nonomuraea indica]|uniref:hypothetical protein n=1 Tax=Nonomuraea indica TaxID=1581193 RepID=UPI000C7C7563|nr:hypothetical protein [Nonomuraea indica]